MHKNCIKKKTHPRGDHGVVPVLVHGVGDAAEVDEHRDERREVEEGRQASEPKLLRQQHHKGIHYLSISEGGRPQKEM